MADELLTDDEARELRLRATERFKPASPITIFEFFSGRLDQLDKTYEAIFQEGQHVVLFGERGVGKTSLANIIGPYAAAYSGTNLIIGKVNCDGTDTFDSVWEKVLSELAWTEEKQKVGFAGEAIKERRSIAERLSANATPNDVRKVLASLAVPVVLIFDEFDRLPPEVAKQFTDVIKALSDYSVPSTVILVGVADTVTRLIKDHASIDRALVQIPMPRMSDDELTQILTSAAEALDMDISDEAIQKIVRLSQGLPHYTHLVGLASFKDALNHLSRKVIVANVDAGLKSAVDGAQHSIKAAHHKATSSSRQDALFKQVLTACALAPKDQLSYFRAADVAPNMSTIMGRRYDIPAFARHLKEFCSVSRGRILERVGESRNIAYRFTNPLMEPYVVMLAMSEGLIH